MIKGLAKNHRFDKKPVLPWCFAPVRILPSSILTVRVCSLCLSQLFAAFWAPEAPNKSAKSCERQREHARTVRIELGRVRKREKTLREDRFFVKTLAFQNPPPTKYVEFAPFSLIVGDDLNSVVFPNTDARIRGAQIDADRGFLRHSAAML
jgi:hypothetical protein